MWLITIHTNVANLLKICKHFKRCRILLISRTGKVNDGKCTISVYEQLFTLVHQCVYIEVTANISKDITLEAV